MSQHGMASRIEEWIFRRQGALLGAFAVATLVLLGFALQTRVDTGFEKQLPLGHEYIQTFIDYRDQFGGANRVMIALMTRDGDIFKPEYFDILKAVTDEVYAMPGVDQSSVTSLFTPNVRFIEVVEDGFSGGNVIPADFQPTPEGLALVRRNILKASIMGRLVARDFKGAVVTANLLEIEDTGGSLDYFAVADHLEVLRRDYEDRGAEIGLGIHIIGFAKVMGDIRDGALNVISFFGLAVAMTLLLVWIYAQSFRLAVLPVVSSLAAVAWQLGGLHLLGFGIDPMSILVPFLVFAIGVSHGVQMVRAYRAGLSDGQNGNQAAREAFRQLLIPGGVALLTDTIGFVTILLIPIETVRELALAASLGVAAIILTNLFLLPLWLSKQPVPRGHAQCGAARKKTATTIWTQFTRLTSPKKAAAYAILAMILFGLGLERAQYVEIGDLHQGIPELRPDSRYNRDSAVITSHFNLGVDILTVFAETHPDGSVDFEVMDLLDRFEWHMKNTPGVQMVLGLAGVARTINVGWNEGSLKWRIIPWHRDVLAQAVGGVETSTGLTNQDGSVLPVMVFLEDHKAATLATVVKGVKQFQKTHGSEKIKFRLAGGSAGVMAAANEVVEASQFPILLYVFAAVVLLCLISFRSIRAVICIVLPLSLVSVLAYALMHLLEIGLKSSTLPVVALGVGIGVDYGIYLYSRFADELQAGHSFDVALQAAMLQAGSAVLFTGLTLAAGVSTWIFSMLQFQADMGVLLTFMFVTNMLCAILLLPAIARLLHRDK